MKTVKKIAIVLAVIISIPLIAALIVKKEYQVVKDITIQKPRSEVYDYVKYLKNQDEYSKWAAMDPNMKKEFKGTDATVGFVAGWESKNEDVGVGEQEITKITEGERIDYEVRFKEPFESKLDSYMALKSVSENETQVTWAISGKMPYPMNLMGLFMNMEEEIGKDLETGLQNLKKKLE